MRFKWLIAFASLLVLACSLGVDADGDGTDWDWAYSIARDAVDERYGEHWYVRSFGAEYLNISGNLYEGMTFPEWDVYFSDGTERVLWVFIHEDGQFSIFEYDSSYYYNVPLSSTYNSHYVQSWLLTASQVYREMTGRNDDVCYELDCESQLYGCDLVTIYLFNEELEGLGYVELLPWNNQITEFWF